MNYRVITAGKSKKNKMKINLDRETVLRFSMVL